MKKLFILLIGILLFVNSYSQIASLTYSPQNNDVGISFISNPVIELQKDICFYSSTEYAYYDSLNSYLFRFAIGTSIILDETALLNTALNFVFYDTENYNYNTTFIPEPFSLEIGVTLKFTFIKNTFISILGDPFNYHFKFGLGYKF